MYIGLCALEPHRTSILIQIYYKMKICLYYLNLIISHIVYEELYTKNNTVISTGIID